MIRRVIHLMRAHARPELTSRDIAESRSVNMSVNERLPMRHVMIGEDCFGACVETLQRAVVRLQVDRSRLLAQLCSNAGSCSGVQGSALLSGSRCSVFTVKAFASSPRLTRP